MTQPRDALKVTSGFWEGVHAGNLKPILAPDSEDPRLAESILLADYNKVFGPSFTSCRKDIRPHLDERWANALAPPDWAVVRWRSG